MVSVAAPTPRSPAPFGQLWPRVQKESAPSAFAHAEAFGLLQPGQTIIARVEMPGFDRLYGTLIRVNQAAADSVLRVRLYGSEGQPGDLYDLQYTGTAQADNGYADPYQQWRYRDFDYKRTLRIEITNTGSVPTAGSVTIEGEPF